MSDALLVFTKLVLAVLLFPVAWAAAVVFHHNMSTLPGSHDEFFFWGMFGYLMVYFFFYRFEGMFEVGQRVIVTIFQFMQPANQFLRRIIPFYLTVIFVTFYVTSHFLGWKGYDHYFMFFAGFTFTMHLIYTAQEMQEEENSFLKPAYLLVMMIVFILFLCITVLLYNLAVGEFTFPDFVLDVKDEAWDMYYEMGQRVLFQK